MESGESKGANHVGNVPVLLWIKHLNSSCLGKRPPWRSSSLAAPHASMHHLASFQRACLAIEVDAAKHFGRLGTSLEGREREGRHQLGRACLEVGLLENLS